MAKIATRERKTVKTEKAEKAPAKARVGISLKPKAARPAPVAEPQPQIEEVGPVCAHRWRIESPNGETSHGVCRICGAERDFPNAAEDGLWERNVPQSRWTGRTDWTPADRGF